MYHWMICGHAGGKQKEESSGEWSEELEVQHHRRNKIGMRLWMKNKGKQLPIHKYHTISDLCLSVNQKLFMYLNCYYTFSTHCMCFSFSDQSAGIISL